MAYPNQCNNGASGHSSSGVISENTSVAAEALFESSLPAGAGCGPSGSTASLGSLSSSTSSSSSSSSSLSSSTESANSADANTVSRSAEERRLSYARGNATGDPPGGEPLCERVRSDQPGRVSTHFVPERRGSVNAGLAAAAGAVEILRRFSGDSSSGRRLGDVADDARRGSGDSGAALRGGEEGAGDGQCAEADATADAGATGRGGILTLIFPQRSLRSGVEVFQFSL